eukprot:7794507-Pyramimonas_sp.AAC.1
MAITSHGRCRLLASTCDRLSTSPSHERCRLRRFPIGSRINRRSAQTGPRLLDRGLQGIYRSSLDA